jgi:hypothetical protein
MSVKSSFISTQEQVVKLNDNNIQILAGLNEIVTSKASQITVDVIDDNDQITSVELPTVGYIQEQIDRLDQNLRTLSGVDSRGAVVAPANNVFQKIIRADLNKEPNSLGSLNGISNFSSINNSFFDALLNPILAVEFDLTDKIEDNVRKVLSRRYIIEFQKDEVGNLTDQGQDAQNLFNEQFKGRTDITIVELENWILNTPGIVAEKNGNKIIYDEQRFDLEANSLEYDGVFTILGVQEDSVNRKMWYLFDTLDYYRISDNQKSTLQIGDTLIINTEFATTRFKVIEISNAASEIRVNLSRVEGYEPPPVAVTGGLKYYSGIVNERTASISVGFDEYNVVFLKPINTDNNLVARKWSDGVSFYTNDLTLIKQQDTGEDGISMTEYYINTVHDYGKILKDLAEKEIPSDFALTPNTPALNIENFKVYQVNKNITDNDDTERLKNLHAQSITYRSQLEELNKTIIDKNRELTKRKFNNPGDKQKVENEIEKLVNQANNVSKSLESTVNQIIAEDKQIPDVSADYRVRGFWSIPEPVTDGRTRPQEVIQFKVQYRYLSTTGQENATESFTITDENGNTINASFSNWFEYDTQLRGRTFNVTTGTYLWSDEDIANPNVLNTNQLDVKLNPSERVEIRIKSISEVGWPTAIIESDWSDPIVISFPTELLPPNNREAQIIKQAELDGLRLEIEQDFNNQGLSTHLSGSFTDNNIYYSHSSDNIAVVDDGGVVKLTDKLISIQNNDNVEEEKDLILEDGWINFGSGYAKAAYYKHEHRLYLGGLIRLEQRFDNQEDDFDYSKRYPDLVIRSGNPTSNVEFANIAYLPVNYRPNSIKTFIIPTSIGETEDTQTGVNSYPWGRSLRNNMDFLYGRVDVYPNGLIRLVSGATGWVSLEGLNFRLPKNPLTEEDTLQTENILQLSRLNPNS